MSRRIAEFCAFSLLALLSLLAGVWFGSVATAMLTYQHCAGVRTVNYSSFIFEKPLTIQCSVSTGETK